MVRSPEAANPHDSLYCASLGQLLGPSEHLEDWTTMDSQIQEESIVYRPLAPPLAPLGAAKRRNEVRAVRVHRSPSLTAALMLLVPTRLPLWLRHQCRWPHQVPRSMFVRGPARTVRLETPAHPMVTTETPL